MDDVVAQSMMKWPNVPSAYGWLELDRRGQWRIKGARMTHPNIAAFIARNYACDELGRWYFQNGPQRVFVRLHFLPYVLRVHALDRLPSFVTHTGRIVRHLNSAWLDEECTLCLAFEEGVGSVHDQDLAQLLPFLSDSRGAPIDETALDEIPSHTAGKTGIWLRGPEGRLEVKALQAAQAEALFNFVRSPAPAPGEPEC